MSVGADEAMKYVLSGRTTDDDHPNQWQLQAVLQKKKKKNKSGFEKRKFESWQFCLAGFFVFLTAEIAYTFYIGPHYY